MNISWIFGVLVAGLVIYEFVALYRGRGETISENFWHIIVRWPVVLFLAGFLSGHLFWRVCN